MSSTKPEAKFDLTEFASISTVNVQNSAFERASQKPGIEEAQCLAFSFAL